MTTSISRTFDNGETIVYEVLTAAYSVKKQDSIFVEDISCIIISTENVNICVNSKDLPDLFNEIKNSGINISTPQQQIDELNNQNGE